MVAHAFNPRTWEAGATSRPVWSIKGVPGLPELLLKKKKKKKKEKNNPRIEHLPDVLLYVFNTYL